MRIPTRRRRYGLRFDLTAMNDIIFLLIILLIAAEHFTASADDETVIPDDVPREVELAKVPKTKTATSQAKRRLEITVHRDGKLQIGSNTVTMAEIDQRIEEAGEIVRKEKSSFELRLRVDTHATYSQVEPLLITCARAGIVDLKFAVLSE